MTTDTDEINKFIESSSVNWAQVPVGLFVVLGECPDNDRLMDCGRSKNTSNLRFRRRHVHTVTGNATAIFGRPRSPTDYNFPIVGKKEDTCPRIWGRVPTGIRVPRYTQMRALRETFFAGLPLGTMIKDDKGGTWRLIDKDHMNRFTVHQQGQGHAHVRVHPGFGITEYFNHKRYVDSPFRIKGYGDDVEYADDVSIMLPSPKDVQHAQILAEMHHKRRDMSTWVPPGYVPPAGAEPEKVYANEWVMLDDLCG